MKIGMRNKEVAQVLEEIGYRLEIDGKEPRFKIQAYARAARTIEGLAQAIEEIAANKKLEDIEGIGSSIAKKIEEILTTGTCKKLEELRKQVLQIGQDNDIYAHGVDEEKGGLENLIGIRARRRFCVSLILWRFWYQRRI